MYMNLVDVVNAKFLGRKQRTFLQDQFQYPIHKANVFTGKDYSA